MNEPHLVQADYNRLLELTSENAEQCRLLSMSAEREYNLRGKIERLERELAIAKHRNDVLMIGMKAIDERVKESKDAEVDLKYCGEIVYAAIAIMEGQGTMSEQKYTIKEITEYIAGWASGEYGKAKEIGQATLLNALNQLNDDQDGIAAVVKRKHLHSKPNYER
jgi:hypothetical protein